MIDKWIEFFFVGDPDSGGVVARYKLPIVPPVVFRVGDDKRTAVVDVDVVGGGGGVR